MKTYKTAAVSLLFLFALDTQADYNYNDMNAAYNMLNQARQSRGIQPLSWSPDLAAYATLWAGEMASGRQPFGHASGAYRPGQGENLYEQVSTSCNPATDTPMLDAMSAWLSQGALYDGQPITGGEHWLHWSQCMWSSTTLIGCAVAYSSANPCQVYDVCRFYPEGNIIGQTPF